MARSASNWFKTFFDESYLRSYAGILGGMNVEQQVDFLMRELRLKPGMRLLDLCCGQGRHAVPLARRGLEVTGQDLSSFLLREARKSAQANGVALKLVKRDMRERVFKEAFDAVINMFSAFGYFEEEGENFRVLEAVARALKPGGRFAIDTINYAWLLRHWEERSWLPGQGELVSLEERQMDWRRGLIESRRLLIEPSGRRRRQRLSIRLFPAHELVAWLERAGLRVESIFGGFDGSPCSLEARRLIVVARKGREKPSKNP